MKQIKASIPDELLEELESAASRAGRSLSEEIRERLVGAADHVANWRPDIGELLEKVATMTILSELTTGKAWDKDPSTAQLLRLAIGVHLHRHGAKEVEQIQPTEAFRREGLVASTDPQVIATTMEALVSFKFRGDDGRFDLKGLRAALEAAQRREGK